LKNSPFGFVSGHDFTACGKSQIKPLLYQGTTLVVPQLQQYQAGFSHRSALRLYQGMTSYAETNAPQSYEFALCQCRASQLAEEAR